MIKEKRKVMKRRKRPPLSPQSKDLMQQLRRKIRIKMERRKKRKEKRKMKIQRRWRKTRRKRKMIKEMKRRRIRRILKKGEIKEQAQSGISAYQTLLLDSHVRRRIRND